MKLYLLLMKKYHYIIILIFIFSCKSKNQSEISWTDKEKDLVFKECFDYQQADTESMKEYANEYCYCTLDLIVDKYNNLTEANKDLATRNNQYLNDFYSPCSASSNDNN